MIELVDYATGEVLDTDSIPGLARVAELHAAQLEQLSDRLEELAEGAGSGGAGIRPIVWARLDAWERKRTWTGMAEWVGWLRSRYPLAQQVPLCWWRHPEVVEEIGALWLAWRDAYVEKGAPLAAGADWHGRVLPDFLRRLGAGGWNVACEGTHRPLVTSLYDDQRVDDPEAFERHVSPDQTHPGEEESDMTDEQMAAELRAGRARRLGEWPDSPVFHADRYWARDQRGWAPVEDAAVSADLADAERRLTLARAAEQGS